MSTNLFKAFLKQKFPKKKEIAKIFERGDIVKTAEGPDSRDSASRKIITEVVTLFSSGKVGIPVYFGQTLNSAHS